MEQRPLKINSLHTIKVLALFGCLLFFVACQKNDLISINNAKAAEYKTTWKKNVDEKTQQFRNIYKKARELEEKKDYKNAYDLYKVLDESYEVLYDFVLFHRAEVAKQIPDESVVIKDLKLLIEKYPDSPLVAVATYSLGQAYVRLKDEENAQKYFEDVALKYPNTDYALASDYYLAEIYSKYPASKEKAIDKFKQYLKQAPDGKFAINAAKGLMKLKSNTLSKEDLQLIGLAYYNGNYFSNALYYLKNSFNEKTWFALGKSYQMTGNKKAAIDTFSRALNSFQGLDFEETLYAVKATAFDKGNNLEAWEYCEKLFPNYADIALYFKAQRLDKNKAKEIYRKILTKFPEGRYAAESSWSVLWDFYNQKQYNAVIQRGKEHVNLYPDSKSTPKVVFWVAKSYEKLGQNENAITIYERLVNHYPGDYYAYRAKGRINELKYGKTDTGWTTNPNNNYSTDWEPPVPMPLEEVAQKLGDKAAELLYLGDIEDLNYIVGEEMNPLIEGYIHLKNGLKSKSMITIRDKEKEAFKHPPGQEIGWELLYPLHYSAIIKKHAQNNSLDPLLVQALTREESYFNPQAISVSNAKGLMQLIPSTASGVAKWEKMPSFNQFDLFTPETNLRFGTRYLKYTHDRFSGNSMLAVAAYNGGPGSVNKWLGSIPNDDWDQFVENIPYDETRNYIKKVFKSYWNYQEIYTNKDATADN